MIKTVEIQEFDKDVLKVGSFISFCYTRKNMTDVGIAVINGVTYNGMIKHVDSKNITITLHDGEIKRIFIEEILNEEKRILGVLSNAIASEEPKDTDTDTEPVDTDVEPTEPTDVDTDVDVDVELQPEDTDVTELDAVEPDKSIEDIVEEEEKEV